jgi:hypothetical protein
MTTHTLTRPRPLSAGERKGIYLAAQAHLAETDFGRSNTFVPLGDFHMYYACCAIAHVSHVMLCDVERLFPELLAFHSGKTDGTSAWLSEFDDGVVHFRAESREGNDLRQIALIFAAELCDDKEFQDDLKTTNEIQP